MTHLIHSERRRWLEHLVGVGVEHCLPHATLPSLLPTNTPRGRNIVLGAGKAAAEMAMIAHRHLKGLTEGLVVTRYGHGARGSTGAIRVLEASHPIPDDHSVQGATRMLELAATAGPDDRVIFLFSGGGSALLCAPINGVSVDDKRRITRCLLHAGAAIARINLVRRHLSRIKGGRLAACIPDAELLTYVISDVADDNPADVASGPSISGAGSAEDAIDVLKKYGVDDLTAIARAIHAVPLVAARPHPVHTIATAKTAIAAIVEEVRNEGFEPIVLGSAIEGDATSIGREHALIAKSYLARSGRFALISGGELTVTVRNQQGRGGPNLEYLTSLMMHLDGAAGIDAIACDSDGIDGSEDNAGGYIAATSLARLAQRNLEPAHALRENNTYKIFAELRDLIITGPTRTNVNDIRIITVEPTEAKSNRSADEFETLRAEF